MHGTFWKLHIKINLKINISETNRSIKLEFCMLSIFKIYHIQYQNHKILVINMAISKFNKTQSQCPLEEYTVESFITLMNPQLTFWFNVVANIEAAYKVKTSLKMQDACNGNFFSVLSWFICIICTQQFHSTRYSRYKTVGPLSFHANSVMY